MVLKTKAQFHGNNVELNLSDPKIFIDGEFVADNLIDRRFYRGDIDERFRIDPSAQTILDALDLNKDSKVSKYYSTEKKVFKYWRKMPGEEEGLFIIHAF